MTDEQRTDLLDILFHEPQAVADELAVRLGLDPAAVAAELERLAAEGILRGQRGIIDWERAGAERIFAFVDVTVRPESDFGFDAIAHRVALFDEVVSLQLVSGTHDLLAIVSARNVREVARFISEKLAPLKGVEHTATSFVLRRYKDDGQLMYGDHDDSRLAVTP